MLEEGIRLTWIAFVQLLTSTKRVQPDSNATSIRDPLSDKVHKKASLQVCNSTQTYFTCINVDRGTCTE